MQRKKERMNENMGMDTGTERLFDFLKAGVSPFGCVEAARERLLAASFEEIDYKDPWDLRPGGKYVMTHHGSALFAFTVGQAYRSGGMLRMAAAHTDHPCLCIKPNPDFATDGYAQVNVEVYGSPILATWFDRPLGVAGRVVVRSGDFFAPRTLNYCSAKPILVVPNLAIHMNRNVNKGVEINRQTDTMPIIDLLPEEVKGIDYFMAFLAEELSVEKEDILDFELNTFCMEEPCMVGVEDTMISAPRLDNQTSVYALLEAVIQGQQEGINLIALFNHEEVGNRTKQGAASTLLGSIVRRILRGLGNDEEQTQRAIYEGMLLSVDVAHGLHPNKKSKMDITNHPVLGKGLCIKQACSQSYATDAEAAAILRQICDSRKIPYQVFVNRSDEPGGGTLGAVASTLLPVRAVDIGVPLLAMHSARELMGTADMQALTDAVTAFFSV